MGDDCTFSDCPATLYYHSHILFLPGVSGEVVDRDLTVLPFQEVLEHTVGQVEVQGVRVVEVVVVRIVMVFLGEALVEGVQGDVGAVQTYTFYDTRKNQLGKQQKE